MVVTIDGPAGTGKSSVARQLANRLGFQMLDTGAMYRIVALLSLREAVAEDDTAGLAGIAERTGMETLDGRAVAVHPTGDREDVTDAIRTPEVTRAASFVARVDGVRSALVEKQRAVAVDRDVVSEGRDQGTVVFPDARHKFFLDASVEVRALRRQRDLEERGHTVDLDELRRDIADRDQRDRNREVAPLRPADDAITIDTSNLTLDEVVDELERHVT